MAVSVKGGYECGYCRKFYTNPVDADNCKESHDLVYVALSKDDLNRLVTFLFTREEAVLGERIVERLQSYLKGSFSLELTKQRKDNIWEQ